MSDNAHCHPPGQFFLYRGFASRSPMLTIVVLSHEDEFIFHAMSWLCEQRRVNTTYIYYRDLHIERS